MPSQYREQSEHAIVNDRTGPNTTATTTTTATYIKLQAGINSIFFALVD